MERNTLQGHFDDLREQFRSMDNADLSKEDRLNVFRQAQQTLKSIDHAVSYAKGTDTVNFGFSSILHMSTLPPLENEQRSAYQAEMNSFFEDIFKDLDDETIVNIFKGLYEIREKQAGKAGLPQLSENQNHEPSEHEAEVYKVSDAEIQHQIDKVRKIFPRMDSEAQMEAESSYKQCFATIQKVNKMAKDSDAVGDFNIGFSKILDESHFEARLFADIKGLDVTGVAANGQTADVSTSRELRLVPSGAQRSLAEIAVGKPKVVDTLPDKSVVEDGDKSLMSKGFEAVVKERQADVSNSVSKKGGLCAAFRKESKSDIFSYDSSPSLDIG